MGGKWNPETLRFGAVVYVYVRIIHDSTVQFKGEADGKGASAALVPSEPSKVTLIGDTSTVWRKMQIDLLAAKILAYQRS